MDSSLLYVENDVGIGPDGLVPFYVMMASVLMHLLKYLYRNQMWRLRVVCMLGFNQWTQLLSL